MLRAELPVHKNRTLYGCWLTGASRRAIGRAARRGRLRLDHIGPVDRALAGREERLPFDALRIFDPALLALSVAAGRLALPDNRAFGPLEPPVDFGEFCAIFDLDAQVLHSRGLCALADGEVHAWILEHP